MRSDLLIPLTSTAEYWSFVRSIDPITGGATDTYSFSQNIRLMITETQGTRVAFARELLSFNGQLRNVKDVSGNNILDAADSGRVAYLGPPIAQFDVFGNTIGYRYHLTVSSGTF